MEQLQFAAGWTGCLLCSMENHPDADAEALMHECSSYHFYTNQMDTVLEPYVGRLKDFIQFLEQEWGWKISYCEETQTLIADENKPACICPLAQALGTDSLSPVLCHCSEGFAQKMFSKVTGTPVGATVIRSILRGGSSCVYQVHLAL